MESRTFRFGYAAAACGVVAVAVLAGWLLIGNSARRSLAELTRARPGATDFFVTAETPFTEALGIRLIAHPALANGAYVAPVFTFDAVVERQPAGVRASGVRVHGVDVRFFEFHSVAVGAPTGDEALLSPDLAAEIGASPGDVIVVDAIRATVRQTLTRAEMRGLSLTSGAEPVRAVFLPLARVQQDLEQSGRVNTLLVARGQATLDAAALIGALDDVISGDDLGLRFETLADRTTSIKSTSGWISDPVNAAIAGIATRRSIARTEMLSWPATRMAIGDRAIANTIISGVSPAALGDATLARLLVDGGDGDPPVVLADQAASDLAARPGQTVTLEYQRWTDDGRRVTEQTTFRVAGVVSMNGEGEHTAAFVPLAVAQELWRTRHGAVSSVRLRGVVDASMGQAVASVVGALRGGLRVTDVRTQK